MPFDPTQPALDIINQMQALVAYWNTEERCLFSNRLYRAWFRKNQEEMQDISIKELLGPRLYELNQPYIRRALQGERQIFMRTLPNSAASSPMRCVATYTPDIVEGTVRGFCVHVTELPETTQEMLPVCANCKSIRSVTGEWHTFEDYWHGHSSFTFTHGLCPNCIPYYFPNLGPSSP